MIDPPVVDQAVRDRVTTDLQTTFLLQASAGTGKTRVLVDRYLNCLLDASRGSGDVRTVAAITFTEKAAGELRQRVREELERRVAGHQTDAAAREVARAALDRLDDAPIATIHGFAGRVLREFPVEAGVDPAFEQLDALAADLLRARLWDDWLTALAEESSGDNPARGWLSRLLRAGVQLHHVQALAAGQRGVFSERYDVDPAPQPPPPPDLHAALAGLAAPIADLREFCVQACRDQSDKGFAAAMDAVDQLTALADAPPTDVDALAARLYSVPFREKDVGGRKANWDSVCGGKDELQCRYRSLADAVARLRDAYAACVCGLALAVADAFARWAAETQINLGYLDFSDLLGRLRDVLRDDRRVRASLQARFRYVLVDEFQDTDPLQAEIVFLLCERTPQAADWRSVVLEPGKLFLVGDPKQSIYRFRRADMSMYDEVADLIAAQPGGRGAVETITQNFRTTAGAVNWVNRVFDGVFESDREKGRQPGYQRVDPYRPAGIEAPVALLLGREYGAKAGENDLARRDEARAIAALLQEMCLRPGDRWLVHDRTCTASLQKDAEQTQVAPRAHLHAEPTRPARWGDVALLLRSTTGLAAYEQALREAGAPYRVEGGTTYFERREVADALVCLRAIDDPTDGPAVYAALHSTLFGFSDDDLYLFVAGGGCLDVFVDQETDGLDGRPEIVEALSCLRDLHEARTSCPAHELIAKLVRVTHSTELAATTGSGAPQAIANLEKLVDRARAFEAAGGSGLADFLSWAADAGDAAGEQESQVDDEGDVVHLLTIHKAKGLEYPIVVLAGGALPSGGGRESVRPLVDRGARSLRVRLKAELPGAAACDLEPAAYRALKEREAAMDASEIRRLLYVAATRARDHLILTCFGGLTKADGAPKDRVMLAALTDWLPALGPEPCAGDRSDADLLVLAPREPLALDRTQLADAASIVAGRERWLSERKVLLDTAGRPAPATSPSGLEHLDEDLGADGLGVGPGQSTARALGTAVHQIMELCDLDDHSSVHRLAPTVAASVGRPDVAAEAARLAGECWRSAPVRAAARAERSYRELPIGFVCEGVVVTGSIDLLYLDGSEWVVVDYKTDHEQDTSMLRRRYEPQGAAYALAAERVTGGVVREVVVVRARFCGETVLLSTGPVSRSLAVAEIRTAAANGLPLAGDESGPVPEQLS